ncbi:MAG: hypothetical protein JWR77_988 [Rhizorhabdus sp.]|nr:hypothetical protein [Rhizorhabdus sp.]
MGSTPFARGGKRHPATERSARPQRGRLPLPQYQLPRLNGPDEIGCFWPNKEPFRLPSIASEIADAMARTRDVEMDLIMPMMEPKKRKRRPQDQSSQGGVVSPAPEPATWGMMILGFAEVGAMMRRQGGRPPPGSG